jgi:hypothetical protein
MWRANRAKGRQPIHNHMKAIFLITYLSIYGMIRGLVVKGSNNYRLSGDIVLCYLKIIKISGNRNDC